MQEKNEKINNIEWLGLTPKEWGKTKIKYITNILNGYSFQSNYYTEKGIFIIRITNISDGFINFTNPKYYPIEYENEIKECILKDKDILMTLTGDVGYVGIFKEEYPISGLNQRVACIRIKNEKIQYKYLFYLLYTKQFEEMARINSYGTAQLNMSTVWLSNVSITCPSLIEQKAIVKKLDTKCQKIDDTIEKINKQIEVLKKYKQSLITEVVTKGLDKNVPMKDSGVDWIGKIPKKWEVKRLKYVINSLVKGNGITKEEVIEDGDTPCVRYGELYTKYNHSFVKCISYTNKDIIETKQYFYKNSILFTCTGELIEEIGKSIVYKGNEECLAGGDILVATTSENAEFINYVSNSYAQIQKSMGKAKLKVVHISAFDISNLLIAIPTIDEQNKIVEYLNSKCLKIDNILDKKSKQIEILKRYKKSLIYEYVTGKKGVKQ